MNESTKANSIKTRITDFVNVNAGGEEIEDDTPIFDLGYVNSLFAIDLMCFLESNFQIKIITTDLDLNNFRTIQAICSFVENKQKICNYER